MENIESEENKKKIEKTEWSLRDLLDTTQWTNILTVGVPGQREAAEYLETGNSPNLRKDMNVNIQEAQKTPSKRNSKKFTERHNIIKLSKDKEF